MRILRILVLSAIFLLPAIPPGDADESNPSTGGWKNYVNGRFGFTVQYPPEWQVGQPLADGMGIILLPPIPNTQLAVSGFLNIIEGTSQDGRQTLQEFTAAHRRIIGEAYAKKNIHVKWEQERLITLGGKPAVQLTFSYHDASQAKIIELHIFSLGRNEGRGVRIKVPESSRKTLMPTFAQILQTYEAGRDQDAVSPFARP
ncbi:MAG TPA: hypothetical protein VGJ57_05695 [Nitrospirales bacterium]|jgi:hypothetical protein